MELPDLYRRSISRFADRVDAIDDSQWGGPTPDTEWDVRALVNHVLNEQRWAPHLMAGATIEEVGDRYDGDLLGDDPRGRFRAGVEEAVAAFAAADLDAVVHLSFGDLPGREYLVQMLTDAEVHGWDLAVATGQDESLDREVVAVVLPAMEAQKELIRGSGVFGPEVAVGEGADDGARLLGLLGRQP